MNRAVSIRARKQATTRIKREQMRCQMKQEEKEFYAMRTFGKIVTNTDNGMDWTLGNLSLLEL